ncbi:unnamed protein product [Nippostrongylus brasiliensis]|uniref:AAA_12 domain-containing protein n=1 Tax=Nippostrongylus brasiliensis TaxID=27835 RepID=A0A0N4XRI5_NIPBR|nr:unnamed protein product [Nippostrongylus brasiliensis]
MTADKKSWVMQLFNDKISGVRPSNEEKLVVAEEAYFSEVPRSYFFDILLFGEWVERAASLKSGSIVILKNLHSFVSKSHTRPILAMHEGTGLRRDIVEVDMDKFGNHYRCLKLTKCVLVFVGSTEIAYKSHQTFWAAGSSFMTWKPVVNLQMFPIVLDPSTSGGVYSWVMQRYNNLT